MKKKLFLFFVFTFIVYLLSSGGNTPFNYFTRLANAFLHGRYYITENPSWLSELIPGEGGKYFVVYPPMPAIIAMPFIAIFGPNFPQQIIAHLLGASVVVLTIKLALILNKDMKVAFWVGTLVGFGTIIWYLSSVGSSWYLGQITAAFFLTTAIIETVGKKRLPLIAILLGCAYLSRIHTIMSMPFFVAMLMPKLKRFNSLAKFLFPLLIILSLDFSYNFIRYGVIFNKGYFLIPNILKEPWFSKGLMHPSYIISNLKTMFWSFPIFLNQSPYIKPSWWGLSIWITTPAIVYSLFANIKEKIVIFSWLSILTILGFTSLHGTNGFAQFGYRFAVDFYPFLIVLVIKGVSKTGIRWHHWILLILSIIVNTWGVIFINKLGFVGY